MSFVQRLLNITFTLADSPTGQPNSFTNTNSNQVTLSGLRASASIVNAGAPSGAELALEVYGMPLSMMNQLSTLGMQVILVPRNTVTVTAGDSGSNMTTVFKG